MVFWLSALITIPAFILEVVLLVGADILSPFIGQPWRELVYLTLATPLIEETLRYGVVRLTGLWDQSPRKAIQIGLGIGLFEVFFKSIPMLAHSTFVPLAFLSNISSIPLHVALSCAFFSFVTLRWPKTLAFHVLLNSGAMALWIMLLRLRVAAAPTTATMLVAITTTSVLLAVAVTRRQRVMSGG
jgi:hypothetical protein